MSGGSARTRAAIRRSCRSSTQRAAPRRCAANLRGVFFLESRCLRICALAAYHRATRRRLLDREDWSALRSSISASDSAHAVCLADIGQDPQTAIAGVAVPPDIGSCTARLILVCPEEFYDCLHLSYRGRRLHVCAVRPVLRHRAGTRTT